MASAGSAAEQDRADKPTDRAVRETMGAIRRWWHEATIDIDHVKVIDKVRGESGFTPRYAFMICMAAGIAILGLLLSSPAVVIGAMLLSPLMGPILGAGFALAVGDSAWLREAGKALAVGALFAVLLCAAIVLASPLQTVTPEIAARTRPNLFDLMVALFSALAGSYAMIKGREGTIVGVAIATALMPPLAVVGFGFATGNGAVLGGSLLLFFTNLMTIALTATLMARLYGFRTALSPKQTRWQNIGMAAVFVVLAVPLGISLQRIAWESTASRQANAAIADQFDKRARVSQLELSFTSDPISLRAEVLTSTIVDGAEERVKRLLTRQFGEPVDVTISQLRVGSTRADANSAELTLARMREASEAADVQVSALVERLELVAGVSSDQVLVDRVVRKATVRARPLPGAGLASYRALEGRLAAAEPDWTIAIVPPALPLPVVPLTDGAVGDAGQPALDTAAWAAQRLDTPLSVEGPADAAEAAVEALREKGVRARVVPSSNGRSAATLSLRWLAPDAVPVDTAG